jgi:hypothetical protein
VKKANVRKAGKRVAKKANVRRRRG